MSVENEMYVCYAWKYAFIEMMWVNVNTASDNYTRE